MHPVYRALGKFLGDNGLGDVKICPLCGFVGRFEGPEGADPGSGVCPGCRSDGRSRMCGVLAKMMGVGREVHQVLCLDASESVFSMLDCVPGADVRAASLEGDGLGGLLCGEIQMAICDGAPEHLSACAGAIPEIGRILAPGGVAMFCVPPAGDGCGAEELLSALEGCGFAVESRVAAEEFSDCMCLIMDINPDGRIVVARQDAVVREERSHPIVSVIMPVYNASEFLRQALDSVVGQTLREIEVICVDDGSTDDSADIVLEYASRDPRVRLVRQSNGGAGKARNNGMRYATGDYLHFIDSDDWLDLEAYERISRRMASTGVDVCIFQSVSFDFETGQLNPKMKAFRDDGHVSDFEANPLYFIRNSVVPWDKLTRREVVVENGLRYDETSCANDRSFYFSLVRCARSIMVSREQLIYHRVNNPGSLVGDNRSVNYDAHFVAFNSTMSHYADADDSVKRLMIDACIRDMLNFYDGARDEYRPRIYRQLHEFLNTVDFSPFKTFGGYGWWGRVSHIRDDPDGFSEALPPAQAPQPEQPPSDGEAAPRVRSDVVASLTSYPARIGTVHLVLDSVLNQTVRAGRVLLWLAEGQFPGRETDLPEELLALRSQGLEIRFCEHDLKPHKKYFYAMQEFPDAAVITVDDDVLYPSDTFEKLLESYDLFPRAVSAMRVHRITSRNGRIAPYSEWGYNDDTFYRNPSMQAMATGAGGVLYPPGSIPDAAFDQAAIEETCLFGDDLWLKLHEVENGVPTVLAAHSRDPLCVDGTQDNALWLQNKTDGNDRQLRDIEEHMHRRSGLTLLDRITDRRLDSGIEVSFLWDCHGASYGLVEDFLRRMPKWGELVCYDVPEGDDLQRLSSMWWNRNLTVVSRRGDRTPLFAAAKCARGGRTVSVDLTSFRYWSTFFAAALKAAGQYGRIVADDQGMAASLGLKGRGGGAFNPYATVIDREVLTGGRFVHMSDELSTFAVASYCGQGVPGDAVYMHAEPHLHNDLSLRSIAASLAAPAGGGCAATVDILRAYDLLRARPGMGDGESEYGTGLGSYRRSVCPVCGTASDYMLPGGDPLGDGIKCPSCGSEERHRSIELEIKFTPRASKGAPAVLYVDYPGTMIKHLRRRGADCVKFSEVGKLKKEYDAIVSSNYLHKVKDFGGAIDALRSRLSPKGMLFLTFPMATVKGRLHVVKDMGRDVYDVMREIRAHGFEMELRWNKEYFSADTVDLYSMGNKAVLVCRPTDVD